MVYSGGTWEASFWRVVGTLVGAFVGWAALEANGGSPYLLAVFAVLLCTYLFPSKHDINTTAYAVFPFH